MEGNLRLCGRQRRRRLLCVRRSSAVDWTGAHDHAARGAYRAYEGPRRLVRNAERARRRHRAGGFARAPAQSFLAEPGYASGQTGAASIGERRRRSEAMDFHEQITVIDGLIAAKWRPEVFKAMRAGGITAVNATCIAWEGTRKT